MLYYINPLKIFNIPRVASVVTGLNEFDDHIYGHIKEVNLRITVLNGVIYVFLYENSFIRTKAWILKKILRICFEQVNASLLNIKNLNLGKFFYKPLSSINRSKRLQKSRGTRPTLRSETISGNSKPFKLGNN